MKTTKACPRSGCTRRVEKHKRCKDTFCERKGGESLTIWCYDIALINEKLMNDFVGGCGTEFCWNCKVIYSEDNRHHLASCTFAGATTRSKPSAKDPLYAEGWDKDPEYEAPDDLWTW
jgi:hypothetical protein